MAAMITHVSVAMPTWLVITAAGFVAFVNTAGENASVKENSCNKSATNKATQQKRILPIAAELQDEEGGDLWIDKLIASIIMMQLPVLCARTTDSVAELDCAQKPKTVGNLDNLLYQRNRMEIVNRSAETMLAL